MTTYVDTAVRFVIATLLAGLWQAPLFALAAWLVLRLNASANATTRHSVLAAALFASLILPVATATMATVESSDLTIPRGARSYVPLEHGPSLPKHPRVPATGASPVLSVPATHSIAIPSIARVNLSLPRWVALAIVGIWLVSATLVLARLFLSLVHLERLKRDALPLDIDYRSSLTRWAVATKGSRNVRLCISGEIDIPIAVGLFDAMILIPKRLLDELAPHDIDTIVLHELAHLRRSDDWINAVERVANALLFFNPGIIWLASQLDLEREVACDDWVLQQNDALPYATCLAKVAETAIWPHRPMTAPGAFVTRRGMSIRIERLLAKHRDVRVRTSFGLAGTAVALLGVLGFVAAFVSPSIAYDATQLPVRLAATASARAVSNRSDERSSDRTRTALRQHDAAVAAHRMERHDAAHAQEIAMLPKELVNPHPAPARKPYPRVHVSLKPVVISTARVPAVSIDHTGHHSTVPVPSGYGDSYAHGADAGASSAASDFDQADLSDSSESSDASYPKTPPMPKIPNIQAATKGDKKMVADASDPDYIDELKAVGYTNLTIDQLVQLKAVGIDADFIRGLQKNGLDHPSVDELTKIRAIGVDPGYIADMRKRYGSSLGIDDIVSLRAVGVSKNYIDSLSSAGLGELSPENVIKLRALGVSPEYARALSRAGYGGLSADDIASLRALGIDGTFIDRAERHGFHHSTVEQLIKLKATGVL